jgi:integrase/recombinase XerD
MLTIYRRHRKNCTHRNEGRKYRHCACPIWADGFVDGQEVRKSLGTRDWQKAQYYIREWEANEKEPRVTTEVVTIQQAGERFVADATARQLNTSTIYKYKLLFSHLKEFEEETGIRHLRELDLQTLDRFRVSWKDGPRTSLKKLERLRTFLRFCERRKWIESNPALDLKAPKVPNCPTLPFSREDMLKILAAIDKYAERAGRANAELLRAFVLVLRYSGMRIGDVVQCGPERIDANKLFLYTQKTRVPVRCVLPDFAVRALESAPKRSDRFFFWTGNSTLHSVVGKWQRRLGTLFKLAGVKGHAHMFRDTFAVELLLAGIPLERVSVLLGHQSIRITERHYAPWVRSRQEQLEADLQRAWSEDPVVLMMQQGTPEVHGEPQRPN